MIKISPSLLAANLYDIKSQLALVAQADMLHVDVMDGQFVPNLSMGIPMVHSLRQNTDFVLDVHLMIAQPQRYVDAFAKAGADVICAHLEATQHPEKLIDQIRQTGKKVALAIKPNTKAQEILPYLHSLDMVLVMTVEPGFGGQSFLPHMLKKIEQIRAHATLHHPTLEIEVDGGIGRTTAKQAIMAGADVLVMGSALFMAKDPSAEMAYFKTLCSHD